MSVPSALISAIEWLKEGRVEKVLFGAVDEYSDILGYCWHRFHGHQKGMSSDSATGSPVTVGGGLGSGATAGAG